jgi:hypothetical protein
MDKPTLDLTQRAHADCYAFIGRVRLLLVEHNLDAITATTFLRESIEAGGSALSLEQARDIARNYADMAGIQTSRVRRSVNFRTPEAMDTGHGSRGDAPAVGGLQGGDTIWHHLPLMCAGLKNCVPRMSPKWAGKTLPWEK